MSLGEILVVIAILFVVAAILYPIFAQARIGSTRVPCFSHLKHLGVATQLYMQDHDQNVPATNPRSGRIFGANGTLGPVVDPLLPYHKAPDLFRCPNGTRYKEDRELSDYTFRFVLDWSELNENRAYSFRVQPQQGTVLAFDSNHGPNLREVLAPENRWFALRDDTSVKAVGAGQIRRAYYTGNHWTFEPKTGVAAMLMFPNEPFPILERISR